MSTLHKAGRALQAAVGVLMVGALAIANGCMSAGPADAPAEVGDPAVGQATEAMFGSGLYKCATRDEGPSTLVVKDDGTCFMIRGFSDPAASDHFCIAGVCPRCGKMAREAIGCNLQ